MEIDQLQRRLSEISENLEERRSEVQSKCASLRSLMSMHGIDGVYLQRKDSFAWLTCGSSNGGLIGSLTGSASLFITPERQCVIASNIEMPRLVEEESVEQLGFELVCTDWMGSSDFDTARSLVKTDRIYSDLGQYDSDFQKALLSLRYSLTSREIEHYRIFGTLTSLILEQTMISLTPNMSEFEVVGKLSSNLWAHQIEPVNLMCAADARVFSYRHPSPTAKKLEALCTVSLGARHGGLIVSLSRTVSFVPLPSNLERKKDACDRVFEAMVKKTICGMPVSAILEKAIETYREAGFDREYRHHHQGGAIGFLPREFKAFLYCDQVVLNNQGYCWNPTVGGMKSEETIVATEKGPIAITSPIHFDKTEIRCDRSSIYNSKILILQ
ncbi:MAG: M24 family metallopeptidase [Sphaerochaetaceae bacterium]|nr:M24 family metallopeptidase [Sphaerochaetaceae bacterium]